MRFVDGVCSPVHDATQQHEWRSGTTDADRREQPIRPVVFEGESQLLRSRTRCGQTPTFYTPQRIGDVSDIGAIDVTKIDVTPHSGDGRSERVHCSEAGP